MADERQTTVVLDDFNRADEIPLSGGGNWAEVIPASGGPLELDNNNAEPGGANSRSSYWTPMTMDNDDCECWAEPVGGNSPSLAWGVGLYRDPGTSTGDGYLFRSETTTGGGRWRMYKLTDGTFTQMGAEVTPTALSGGGSGKMSMIRRNGNDIEGWYDGTADGVYDAFTLIMTRTDTDYMTDMHAALELFGSDILAWDNFGAGADVFVPQIYRREQE